MKLYLEGDLFYKSTGISGYAQVPHCFTKSHIDLLNKIVERGTRHEDNIGRIFYILNEQVSNK